MMSHPAIRMVQSMMLLGLLTGCAMNPFGRLRPDYSTLPADTMREVARDVEMAVRLGTKEPAIKDRPGVVINEESLIQAVRTRALRHKLIDEFRATGHGWERANGRLYIIRSRDYKKAYTRRDKDRHAVLINAENRDRWTLYEGLIDVNNLPPKSLSAIEEIFFEERVKLMPSGQKVEGPDGEPQRTR